MTDTVRLARWKPLTAEPCHIDVPVKARAGVWVVHKRVDLEGQPTKPTEWTITHAPTGLRVAARISLREARALLERLGREVPSWQAKAKFGAFIGKRSVRDKAKVLRILEEDAVVPLHGDKPATA